MSRMDPIALARGDRDRRGLRLRAQGLRWPEIARECGYTNAHHALVAVQRLLRRETHDDVAMARSLQIERIEALIRSLWLAATNPGAAVRIAAETGQPAPLSQAKAHDLLRSLMDSLAHIEGLW